MRLTDDGARFRLRFVGILLAVSLLPVGAASWAFGRAVAGNEAERADLRLATALGVSTSALADVIGAADARAVRVAGRPSVQRALLAGDRRSLAREARRHHVLLTSGRLRLGAAPRDALLRGVDVVRAGRRVGRVEVAVPLDPALARRLTSAAADHDELAIALVRDGRVVASPPGTPLLTLAAPSGRPVDARTGGTVLRTLLGPPVSSAEGVRLAALVPRAAIERAIASRRRRVAAAAVITLLTVVVLGWVLSPVLARGRIARRSVALVGDALAATHDTEALLPVILETSVEATGAAGGRLVDRGRELARAGNVYGPGEPLALPLVTDGDDEGAQLLLHPPPEGFREEARELARWLAAQASIALENARLHAVVKEQAVTDPLTDLANRRRFMATLATELQRAERFGGPLAVVLADLDDFKAVNDTWGHATGDEVLRAVADVLRARLRDIDLPARLGGEEFAVLLPETDLAGAEHLAERLRSAVAGLRLDQGRGGPAGITASFGVAAYPAAASPSALLAAADEALYAAKLRGKNRVVAAAAQSR